MTPPTAVPVTQLPDTIRSYLAAHAAHDVDAALAAFDAAAEVLDDGRTFRGTAELREFLSAAGAPYRWTTRLLRAERVDDEVWVAHNRLEGDFPGGIVELRYRFALVGGLIARLEIWP